MPPTVTNNRTISTQLRDAIRDSGLSVRELGLQANIDDGMIHRFLAGQRGLTTSTVDKLGEVLGLRLIEGGRRVKARTAQRQQRKAS